MARYLVTYRVKVEAETPEEAVWKAGYVTSHGATDPDLDPRAHGVEVPEDALYSCKEISEVDGVRQWVEVS